MLQVLHDASVTRAQQHEHYAVLETRLTQPKQRLPKRRPTGRPISPRNDNRGPGTHCCSPRNGRPKDDPLGGGLKQGTWARTPITRGQGGSWQRGKVHGKMGHVGERGTRLLKGVCGAGDQF